MPIDPDTRSGTVPRPPAVTRITAGGGDEDAQVVRKVPGGPVLVEGPVRIHCSDGTEVDADRFQVAVCRCLRSERYPICDTSHRNRPSRQN